MKHKIYLIIPLILIALIFFFWPGHPPYEFLMKTLGIESSSQGTQEQSSERDDFGCFYSCTYFPEGYPKQMCEDWKAGKEVQWPPDCKLMQYGPCIQFCESEKKNNPLTKSLENGSGQQQQDSNQNQQQQELEIPTGVPASDPEAGSVYIYIADFDTGCVDKCEIYSFNYTNSRIMRIDDMTGKNWVSFGTIGKGVNQFNRPNHLTVGPDGKIYVADSQNDRIVRMDDMTGKGWITYGVSGRTGESGTSSQVNLPPGEGRLIQPSSVAFDSKGRIYILSGVELARIDDMTGKGWTAFGSAGSSVNQFFKGKALYIDSMDIIYFVDAGNHRIVRIDDMTGKGWLTFGTKGSGVGQFEDELNGVTLDAQGRIYIGDEHNNRIVRIDDMTGKGWVEFSGLPNDKFVQPHDFGITKAGHIYVLDTGKRRVVRIDDMTGKGWIAFAPDAKTEDARYFHKWHMSAPHGMFVLERN
ncbi:MAG TPA: NHL repeat-containing protein [Candidatus Nanoarchaeia archaeon]|nr:NHL repeat-containing protein [Candidatus Nanoarchaeia archaeon]